MSWVDLEADLAEMFGELSVFSRQEQATGFSYRREPSRPSRLTRDMSWLRSLPPLPEWRAQRGHSPWKLTG